MINHPAELRGGFYHAGQVCVSVQRVYVHESIARDVANVIAEHGKKMTVGDPTSADTEVGPLIRPREAERVHDWVQDAVEKGAELISGGERIGETCYTPTVLFNAPDDAKASCNEIFGPVIMVYSYKDMDEALARANSLAVAFQASVWTKNIDRALRAWKHFDASAVMINDHTAFRVDWMPFAGLRESGHGVGGIPHTFHDMQIEKLAVIRSPEI